MLLFKCLPDSQIYPWGVTSYFSSFPNGKKIIHWALLSRKATKQMSGRENPPGWAAPAAPTAAPEVSWVACPGVGRRPEWKHPVLVHVRSWKKAASSMEMISGQMVALVSPAGGKFIRAALRRAWAGLLRPLVTPLGVDTGLPAPSHDLHLSPGPQNPLQRQECKNSP